MRASPRSVPLRRGGIIRVPRVLFGLPDECLCASGHFVNREKSGPPSPRFITSSLFLLRQSRKPGNVVFFTLVIPFSGSCKLYLKLIQHFSGLLLHTLHCFFFQISRIIVKNYWENLILLLYKGSFVIVQ